MLILRVGQHVFRLERTLPAELSRVVKLTLVFLHACLEGADVFAVLGEALPKP
jgi:hypothetical protein